jgi:hypothetical protein
MCGLVWYTPLKIDKHLRQLLYSRIIPAVERKIGSGEMFKKT